MSLQASSLDAATATAAAAAAGPHAGVGHSQPFLRLGLGDQAYAVRVERVREILEVAHLTPVPLMPAFVRGVMNLRGSVVPVIDLAARLGLGSAVASRRSCIIMADVPATPDGRAGGHAIGMMVDAVFEVFEAGPGDEEPPPRLGTRVDPALLRCMVRQRGVAMPELNLDQVLDPVDLAQQVATYTPIQ